MDVKAICTVGFEILAAIGAGLAVFAGIKQATSAKNNSVSRTEFNSEDNRVEAPVKPEFKEGCDGFITGMKSVSDTCGKISTVIQSLVIAAESIATIFTGGSNSYYQPTMGLGRPHYITPNVIYY